jgi:hypothetical protein
MHLGRQRINNRDKSHEMSAIGLHFCERSFALS